MKSVEDVYHALLKTKRGENYGFVDAVGQATVIRREGFYQIDSIEGIKNTDCYSAARYLCGDLAWSSIPTHKTRRKDYCHA